jgi:DNA-binding NtrC family response regulator
MRTTVLVVDDDDSERSLHRSLLAERGYEVLEASDVASALTHLAAQPAAVVLDVDLADGGAERLLERLARRKGSPPVVLCTARPRVARMVRRYHVAALSKFAVEAIADEVERVIAESRRPRLSRISSGTESRPSIS